jgi:hypothetical protein
MSRFMGWWRAFFLAATDAPAVYGEGAGLMALSTLALGHRWVNVGQGVRPNIYMLLTGDSSVARKSTSVRFARQAIEEIAPQLVGPRDYTMEGLYKWMREKNEATGKGRNKFCLFSEEFGSDLARSESYGGTMREDFCSLYDGDDFTKVRAKSDNFTILKPRVNLLGGVAYPLLSRYCSKDDWFIGFFMRFLFVSPIHMREQNDLQPKFPRAAWDTAVAGLASLYDQWHEKPKGLGLTPHAQHLYSSFLKTLSSNNEDAVIPVYLARLGPNLLKLALLYQLDEDPDAEIGYAAMKNACDFTTYCLWPSFQKVYSVTVENEFDAAVNQFREMAQNVNGVSTKAVWTRWGNERGLPSSLLDYAKRSGLFERRLNEDGDEAWRLTQ